MRRALAFALLLGVGPVAADPATDDIARVFADALEVALLEPTSSVNLYTVDEPQAFRIWSAVPPMLATYPCARNVALAVEQGGQARGVVWLGVCQLGGELPADLLATAAARARAAAAEREIAPIAAGFGELVRQRRAGNVADLFEVTVILTVNGSSRILRTALVVPDGSTQVLVLQYEALRLCSGGAAPLCTAPAVTLESLALALLRALEHRR